MTDYAERLRQSIEDETRARDALKEAEAQRSLEQMLFDMQLRRRLPSFNQTMSRNHMFDAARRDDEYWAAVHLMCRTEGQGIASWVMDEILRDEQRRGEK